METERYNGTMDTSKLLGLTETGDEQREYPGGIGDSAQSPSGLGPLLGEASLEPKPEVAECPQAPLSILLVEDQEINRRFVMKMLQRRGHQVGIAQDGKQAIEKWEQGGVDIILMDVQMPVMDGIEATRRIRERESATDCRVPIIALTADALTGDRERLLGQGFTGYVSKPVDMDCLLQEISGLAAGPRRL